MKFFLAIFLFLTVITNVKTGHIYVDDLLLSYQNAKDENDINQDTIWISFALESGLGENDFIRMTFPEKLGKASAILYDMNYAALSSQVSSTVLPNFPYDWMQQTDTYYWGFKMSLLPNVWYRLLIFLESKQTVTETFFQTPITIATTSSDKSFTDTQAIVYDENLNAGLMARAPLASVLYNVNTTIGGSSGLDTKLEVSNELTIDIQTNSDYQYGAFVEITMDNIGNENAFTFKTSCINAANICSATKFSTNCYNISAVESYTCELKKPSASSSSTFRQILFEHKSPITAKKGFRIKTTVLNPYFYTSNSGGFYVRLYSRTAKIWYERKYVQSVFPVSLIQVTNKFRTYFWGLQEVAYNTQNKCPIGIYVTPGLTTTNGVAHNYLTNDINDYIFNKVRIYFQVTSQDFPAGKNYQAIFKINAQSRDYISFQGSSYSSNLPIFAGKRLYCSYNNNDKMEIVCENVGDVKKNTNYWFGVIFVLFPNAKEASGFGSVYFKQDALNNGNYKLISETSKGGKPVFLTDRGAISGDSTTYNDKLANYKDASVSSYWAGNNRLGGNNIISIDTDNNFQVNGTTNIEEISDNADNLFPSIGIQYSKDVAFKLALLLHVKPMYICGINVLTPFISPSTEKTIGTSIPENLQGNNYFCNPYQYTVQWDCDNENCNPADNPQIPDQTEGPEGNTKYQVHTVLKIIFNIDQISTYAEVSQQRKGIQLVGNFFGNGLKNCQNEDINTPTLFVQCKPYDSYNQLQPNEQQDNSLYNIIERISEVSQDFAAYGEATLNCNSYKIGTGKQYCAQVSDFEGSDTASLVAFRNVKFASTFQGNPLFPNEQIFDFIICFRYYFNVASNGNSANKPNSFTYKVNEGSIGSYGVVQANVYYNFMSDSQSEFKLNYVNYYMTKDDAQSIITENNGKVIPTLLRLGGLITTKEFQAQTEAFGVFFDFRGADFSFQEWTEQTNSRVTNQVNCGSTITDLSCYFNKYQGKYQVNWQYRDDQGAISTPSSFGIVYQSLYLFDQVIFQGAFTAQTQFNSYVPIQVKYNQHSDTCFNQIGMQNSQIVSLKYSVTSGNYHLLNNFIYHYSRLGTLTDSQITATKARIPLTFYALDTGIFKQLERSKSYEFESVAFETVMDEIQCNSVPNTDQIMTGIQEFNNWILPSKSVSQGLSVSASVNINCEDLQPNVWNTISSDASESWSNNGFGAAFLISSKKENPFSKFTDQIWSYNQVATLTNLCISFNYKIDSSSSERNYINICPFDSYNGILVSNSLELNTAKVTFKPFTVPWNWGQNYNLNKQLSYSWSSRKGYLLFATSPSQSNDWNIDNNIKCMVNTITNGWYQNGKVQMISFAITLNQVNINLEYDQNGFKSKFIVEEKFDSAISENPAISEFCTASGFSGLCSFIQVDTLTYKFTIDSKIQSSSQSSKTINAGTILTINYWVSTSENTQQISTVKHGGIIKGYNQIQGDYVVINDCFTSTFASQELKEYTGVATSFSQNIKLYPPYFMGESKFNPTKGSRSWFDVSWSVSRPVQKFTYFEINLGWIGSAQQQNLQNVHCIPHSKNLVNFEFSSVNIANLNQIQLKPKLSSLINERIDYSLINQDFSLRCFGGVIPTSLPTDSDLPSISWKIQSEAAEIYKIVSQDLSKQYLFQDTPDTTTIVTLTKKTQNQKGFNSDYTFQIKPSIIYEVGTKLILEFSRSISPKLNKLGSIHCYQEFTPIYCDTISQQRIQLLITNQLDNKFIYGYNFTIRGISQPGQLDNFKKIFVALDTDNDFSNGISFMTNIPDLPFEPQSFQIQLLPILYEEYLQVITKSTFGFKLIIKMPKNSVVQNKKIFVQFSGEQFNSSFFHSYQPQCTFQHAWQNASQNNFLQSCSFIEGGKIQLITNEDFQNLEVNSIQDYELFIKNIPSPNNPTRGNNVVQIFLQDDNGLVTHSSNIGFYNATRVKFFDDSRARLVWSANPIQVSRGVYNQFVSLADSRKIEFSKTFSYNFFGNNATSFKTYPEKLQGIGGLRSSDFYIGAAIGIQPGLYQLQVKKDEIDVIKINAYQEIEPLLIRVEPFNCTIEYEKQYIVYAGGRSLPIKFDFKNCIPQSDVTITLNATQFSEIDKAASFITFESKKQESSKKLTFDPKVDISKSSFSLYFTLFHSEPNLDPNNLLLWEAKLNGKLSGTNAFSYNPLEQIVLIVVKSSDEQIKVEEFTVEPSPGKSLITFQCSQQSNFYFAFSANENLIKSLTASEVQAQTLDKSMQLTLPQPNDQFFTIYGNIDQKDVGSQIRKEIFNVASLQKYYAIGFCHGLGGQLANSSIISWQQSDTGARPFPLSLTFQTQMNRIELAKYACVLAHIFRLENNRIITEYNEYCSKYRFRMLQENITSSTLKQQENITTSTLKQNVQHDFIVIPNYFEVEDKTYENVQSLTSQNDFVSNVNKLMKFEQVSGNITSVQALRPKTLNQDVPTFLITKMGVQATNNQAQTSFILTNTQGFIWVTVAQAQSQRPSFQQLQKGQSGDGIKGVYTDIYFVDYNQTVNAIFTGLQTCRSYAFYFGASNIDPQDTTKFTEVFSDNFTTTGCLIASLANQLLFPIIIAIAIIMVILTF